MVPVSEIVYESRGKLIGGSLSKEREAKSRPSGTRVVTFIGGSDGGIRDPARKRLIRWRDTRSNEEETDEGIRDPARKRLTGYEIQRETVSMNTLRLVWISYSASQRLIQRQCGLQETVWIIRDSADY